MTWQNSPPRRGSTRPDLKLLASVWPQLLCLSTCWSTHPAVHLEPVDPSVCPSPQAHRQRITGGWQRFLPYNSNSAPTLGSLPPRHHEVRIAPVFSSSSLVFLYSLPLPPYFPPSPFSSFALTLLPFPQICSLSCIFFLPSFASI